METTKKAVNTMSNYIYFKRDWFDNVIENDCNEDIFYGFVEVSASEFGDKIRERNKAKAYNKKMNEDNPLPNILEKDDLSYIKLPRLYLISDYSDNEDVERAEMFKALLIASYVSAQGKRDKDLEIKVMKFDTICVKFDMTIGEIGKLMEKYGKYNFCKILKKKERVGRPKMIYYIGFDQSEFYEEFANTNMSFVEDEEETDWDSL